MENKIKIFVGAYQVPGTIFSTVDAAMNKRKDLCPLEKEADDRQKRKKHTIFQEQKLRIRGMR